MARCRMAKALMPQTCGFITLPYRLERAAPRFEGNAIKYPESLVRHFLKRYTKAGDTVFDPFAGLGTTLFVAEELKRVPYGVEADRRRFEWVAGQLRHWQNLRHGDAGQLARLHLPPMDFCMASPPFMCEDEQWNPLYAGDPAKAGYDKYLKRLRVIYRGVAAQMKPGATVVVQVDNLPGPKGHAYTPLVHDVAGALAQELQLQDEVIVAWTGAPKQYTHTHCLVFRA